jgi:hypothetical protein
LTLGHISHISSLQSSQNSSVLSDMTKILLRPDIKSVFCNRKLMKTDIFFTRTTKHICNFVNPDIRVITKLPNSEQSYKGKVKTHNYINRQNQSQNLPKFYWSCLTGLTNFVNSGMLEQLSLLLSENCHLD